MRASSSAMRMRRHGRSMRGAVAGRRRSSGIDRRVKRGAARRERGSVGDRRRVPPWAAGDGVDDRQADARARPGATCGWSRRGRSGRRALARSAGVDAAGRCPAPTAARRAPTAPTPSADLVAVGGVLDGVGRQVEHRLLSRSRSATIGQPPTGGASSSTHARRRARASAGAGRAPARRGRPAPSARKSGCSALASTSRSET